MSDCSMMGVWSQLAMRMMAAPLLFALRRVFTGINEQTQAMPVALFTLALPDELPHRLHIEPGTLAVG